MGLDPITMGLAGSAAVSAYGQYKQQGAATDKYNAAQAQGQSMMKTGVDPYQAMLTQFLGNAKPAATVDPNTGAINAGSILQNYNVGQDALSQFMRSDPSRQMGFDTSRAFDALGAMDNRNAANSVASLNANFGGIGQRFGGAAMKQTSDLLANINASTGARNAGIFQSSFENQQNRALQGAGLMLQGATTQANQGNTMAALAAQIASQNQGNSQWNRQFNQNNQNTYFDQMMRGTQAGFGMQNAADQYNLGLFNVMNGMPAPQGNAFTALGGAGTDMSQLAMLMQMLNKKPGG